MINLNDYKVEWNGECDIQDIEHFSLSSEINFYIDCPFFIYKKGIDEEHCIIAIAHFIYNTDLYDIEFDLDYDRIYYFKADARNLSLYDIDIDSNDELLNLSYNDVEKIIDSYLKYNKKVLIEICKYFDEKVLKHYEDELIKLKKEYDAVGDYWNDKYL